jgi:competence protein ComGC
MKMIKLVLVIAVIALTLFLLLPNLSWGSQNHARANCAKAAKGSEF